MLEETEQGLGIYWEVPCSFGQSGRECLSLNCVMCSYCTKASFHQPVNRIFSEIAFLEVPQILGMNLKGWVGRLSDSSHLSLNTSPLYTQPRTNSVLLRFYMDISCPLSFISLLLSHSLSPLLGGSLMSYQFATCAHPDQNPRLNETLDQTRSFVLVGSQCPALVLSQSRGSSPGKSYIISLAFGQHSTASV